MNDIIWRTIKRAQVPAVKEPASLTLEDNKRPNGTTLLPWAKGKPLAWDVAVPDTYTESHIADTVSTPGVQLIKRHKTRLLSIPSWQAHTCSTPLQQAHGMTWLLS